MLAAVALVLVLAAGSAVSPPNALAIATVPDEPDAFMLPERLTYQAVVADLDGDGTRELVRLVVGDRGSIRAEAWRHATDGWGTLGDGVEVVPARVTTGTQGNVVHAGRPARLIVRTTEAGERITIVRQPRFDEPDLDAECCLLLHDLELEGGVLRLRPVSDPLRSVDAILALDLDGDGVDELLATRSMPPRGDISFPTEVVVLRWSDGRFLPPTLSEVPIGSGDSPFILGDTDGRPGVEAGIITARTRSVLYRLVLEEGDVVRAENSGIVTDEARAVPLGEAAGVAVISRRTGLSIHSWPTGGQADAPSLRVASLDGTILGVVELRAGPSLLVREAEPAALHVLSLSPPAAPAADAVTRSPAAGTLESSPLRPYVGPLPGGGPDGEAAVFHAGHLLPSEEPDAGVGTVGAGISATLAGAEPVGLAGPGRSWMALLHGTVATGGAGPAGGRLDGPVLRAGSGVSLAPLDLVRTEERDDGILEPATTGGVALDGRRTIAVGARGFSADVVAPPGSRIYVSDADPSSVGSIRVVPAGGRLSVRMAPPETSMPNPRYRASLSVATPAGHAYLASWNVRTLIDPPPLSAAAATRAGSLAVQVRGTTSSDASVTVGGRAASVDGDGRFATAIDLPPWPTDVAVVATDVLGNETRMTVSGIGLLDYRGLPWIPIFGLLLGAAAVVLFLRVPRSVGAPRRADDDATLEEMEPD